MSLEAKGSIKYDGMDVGSDGKSFHKYSAKSPQLGIDEECPKDVLDIDKAVKYLERRIQERVQEDFRCPVIISTIGVSVSCSYDIEPINNRTLDEFQQPPAETGAKP